jgi:hypothetical protein
MMRERDTPERGCHSNYLSNVNKKQILRVRCEKFGSYLGNRGRGWIRMGVTCGLAEWESAEGYGKMEDHDHFVDANKTI